VFNIGDMCLRNVDYLSTKHSSFWQYMVYADIHGCSLESRHQMTVRSCINTALLFMHIGIAEF